ncbi:FtsX-like permease family protein [Streptomyces sp. TLI_185]|uniref:FtsX-like permease family protein n=1 Tax=Streptomyces sp. TLI_185 TaxID=2485151 RepID=UPI000FA7EAA2|nr:ABC transporter permease [Streptomyces sp. TLI_185]RPF33578.1 FtsX-like permease family protein [Streptomyces sp. TLI_185]
MTAFGAVARFVLLRARAHRLLLAAALLTVLLTTAVLATLTAYSGAIGDAALRHSLQDPQNAADAALIVKADVPADRRAAADEAVRRGARRTFDGLPVTVRTLVRSGPYALPRSLQPPAERSGNPALTYVAALDPTQVRFMSGRAPRTGSGAGIEAALPQTAARRLGLKPGARLTLVDRLGGPKVHVTLTGLYRPARADAPYWRLDDLGGRGVTTVDFTTYGPLLAAPGVLSGGKVSAGPSGWLASADFSALTTGRIDELRKAAGAGGAALRRQPALSGTTAAGTSLPGVLDRVERSLLVSRSTLLIVALQLALLACCALLLVARLLSAERAGEVRLLRARGASRARVAALAALEALCLAAPAVLCGPLLSGPLTRLLAGQGALARIGLRLEVPAGGGLGVWVVAGAVGSGCALAVTLPGAPRDVPGWAVDRLRVRRGWSRSSPRPLKAGGGPEPNRAGPLKGRADRPRPEGARGGIAMRLRRGARQATTHPHSANDGSNRVPSRTARAAGAPVRAGADLGLLAVAAVAYWQLSRQNSGAVNGDKAGTLGIDPLLVAAPALALLAGTVLTLRLLPLVARLAERRAAGGRGLTAALAGWQLSRRPMRGAGPVLLLVLAVALGMLAIGQRASWNRSQDDQADFGAGAPVRVLAAGEDGLGRTETYAAIPHVREVAPALRADLPLSGDRTAALLALDTAQAADTVLMRRDLASQPVRPLLASLGPKAPTAGSKVPAGTARLRLTAALHSSSRNGAGAAADVTVTLVDRYGTPYQVPAGELPGDGRAHALNVPVSKGSLTLTGVQLVLPQPVGEPEQHRLTLGELTATEVGGNVRKVPLPASWKASVRSDGQVSSPDERTNPTKPGMSSSGPPTVEYGTGYVPAEDTWVTASLTVRVQVVQPRPPEITAVATDRFLTSAAARTGQRVDVTVGGENVPVRIVRAVRELPTTGDADGGALLVDLRSVNRLLETRYGTSATPTEWWLRTGPGKSAEVAAALRALPELDPAQVVVRDETAARLRDDPFGAGAEAAFAAAAGVAAALAAVGFAVSAAGSLRERGAELAVLRALGAPRRRLARMIAVEQGVLVALALVVGTALGTVLARAVIPLIVLTAQATRPVPRVLVELPVPHVAVLLAAVAVTPLLVTAALAVRRGDPVMSLREQGGE